MSEEDPKSYSADIPEDAVLEALESLKKKREPAPQEPEGEETIAQVEVEVESQDEQPAELTREQLIEAVEKARGEAQAARERMLRIAADADNTRKRAIRERDEAIKFGLEGLLRDLLPALDNLERTLSHIPADSQDPVVRGLFEGMSMIVKQFEDTLARYDLTAFSAKGAMFDPSRHEALSNIETDQAPPGTVLEEMHRGYMLHDRLLRPALVTVACQPGGCVEKEAESTEERTDEEN